MSTSYNFISIKEWLTTDEPLIIAGPCSAESENQVLMTAKELTKIPQVKVFRSGIWKPRSRPNDFEGCGSTGLQWLKKVKEQTGLLTAVEVANTKHVEECLKADIDILWIGARTTVNPFYVQEISEVLKGVDIPVMVKNPVNPDIQLWVGAIERLHQCGIRKMIAVHRGFYYYKKTNYRNHPMWEIPIELKRLIPDIPIITDPSHICGSKELLQETSQKALDLEMNGLTLETHIKPSEALSDAQQQLTPIELRNLLNKLIIRSISGGQEFQTKLEQLRSEIDKFDAVMIDIISKRLEIVKEIGKYKKLNNITILQQKRWEYIINDRANTASKSDIERDFLKEIFETIHKESIRLQTNIMNEENPEK